MSPRQDVGLRGPPRVSSPSTSASAAPSSDPRFVHAPSQAPPPVAVPPRSPREAAGTSASTRGARPRLLASRVWPLGDSAGGTESGRPQPPRPQSGSPGLRWPVTVPEPGRPPREAPRRGSPGRRGSGEPKRRAAPHAAAPASRRRVSGAPSRPCGCAAPRCSRGRELPEADKNRKWEKLRKNPVVMA